MREYSTDHEVAVLNLLRRQREVQVIGVVPAVVRVDCPVPISLHFERLAKGLASIAI